MPLPSQMLNDLALEWARGDDEAARFLVNVMHMVRLADDIADEDTMDPVGDMSNLLIRAWLEHATNPFFQRHSAALGASMMNGVLMWDMSEHWRHSSNRKTRMFGFVGREAIEHVAYTVAFICGGYDHAKEVAQQIQEFSHQASPETFEQWEAE